MADEVQVDVSEGLPPFLQDTTHGSRVSALMEQISEVCPVPANAQKVMALCTEPDVDVAELVEAIAADSALTSEVIRIANSPLYGCSGQVTDLRRAVVMLGTQELRSMAAAMVMLTVFKSDRELSLHLHEMCVLTATLSARLAAPLGNVNRSTAWLCGMLCEIGAMACLAVDETGYMILWGACGGSYDERLAFEQERYGAGTGEIGARLLSRNRVPSEVAEAVRYCDASVADGGPLQRLAGFSRWASPMIIRAAHEKDARILAEEVPELARSFGLDCSEVELPQICLDAAQTAELGLQGKLKLLEAAVGKLESEAQPQPAPPQQAVRVSDLPGRRPKPAKRKKLGFLGF